MHDLLYAVIHSHSHSHTYSLLHNHTNTCSLHTQKLTCSSSVLDLQSHTCLSHTYFYTHTYTLPQSHTFDHTYALTHSQPLSHIHTYKHTHHLQCCYHHFLHCSEVTSSLVFLQKCQPSPHAPTITITAHSLTQQISDFFLWLFFYSFTVPQQ